jgi:uncharacterized damage-inducible protein DinB
MTAGFDSDLQSSLRELAAARAELLAAVTALSDADLDTGRRGGWTVRRVLEHVAWSEWMYSRVVIHLRGGQPPGDPVDANPSSVQHALELLRASHDQLLAALDGVDEESFYRLTTMGHEEYSVLSLLENEINHEREHAAQIQALVSG